MALNLATITNDYKTALVAGGADPVSPFTLAFAQGMATALINAMATATVLPTGTPPMVAGPTAVTGTGKVT